MVDLVHQLSGKHIVYVLQCEPLDGKETRYVGTSISIEKRTYEHLSLAKSKRRVLVREAQTSLRA